MLTLAMAEAMLEPVDPGFGRGFALAGRGGHRYFQHGACTVHIDGEAQRSCLWPAAAFLKTRGYRQADQ